jgi:hypothetical protein
VRIAFTGPVAGGAASGAVVAVLVVVATVVEVEVDGAADLGGDADEEQAAATARISAAASHRVERARARRGPVISIRSAGFHSVQDESFLSSDGGRT